MRLVDDADQVGLADDVVAGQDRRPLDDVFQLAHIARPVVIDQRAHRALGNLGDLLAELGADRLEEVIGQRRDVVLALAQRRDMDREDIDSVKEVVAETAVGDHALEVLIGRGDQPEIGGQRLGVTDRAVFALLQHAQHLGLNAEREVADLVEEQAAAVGDLEHAFLAGHRAGEGALDVAEQLALQQVLAQRIAVHRDERFVLAQAVVVDGARDQLLAGAAFAGEQHRRIGRRALRHQPVDRLHLRARSDDVLEPVFRGHLALEIDIFLQELPPFERALHYQLEFVRFERLGDVIEGAELHRLYRRVDLRQAGDHNDVDIGMALLDPAQHFQPADVRHHDVEDQDVVTVLLDLLQCFAAVVGGLDLVVVAVQDAQAAPDDDLLIVNDQNSRAH